MLRRPWFAGGTVDWVSTQHAAHALRPGAEAFEDGTPHFLAARAVCDGLDLLDRIGMSRIEAHVRDMTAQLIAGLLTLRHATGRPLIDVHGPRDMAARGGIVAFNVQAPEMLEDHVALLTDEAADELLALDDALERLAHANARAARVVEQRFFAGLTLEETADVLDVSLKTVQRDWILARAWLRKEIALDLAAADPDSRLS
jgi:selenocysteine lyase/cysteine desulfurase